MDLTDRIDRRQLLLGGSIFFFAGSGASFAAEPVGVVVATTGSAFIERSADRIAAVDGADVLLDDLAVTGDVLSPRPAAWTRHPHQARRFRSRLKIDRFIVGVRTDGNRGS